MTVMRHPRRPGKYSLGFTLMELMITVAIVAILGSLAYPAYRDSVLKGRRAEGRTALVELAQQQERYMTQRGTYLAFSNSSGTTNPTSAATTFKVFAGSTAAKASYWLSATTCDSPNDQIRNCVKLEAVPVQADAEANRLWTNTIGEKGCTGTKPALCWK